MNPYVVVLGVAQDGGHPQAGCTRPCCAAAWADPTRRHRVAGLAIVDPETHQRWLVDCTPDLPEQLYRLDQQSPPGLSGVLLTHAHIGHYTGLMHLGREVMGVKQVPVYAMPRMAGFLENNGPWELVFKLGHTAMVRLVDGEAVQLGERVRIRPVTVPHRDEYSETVGYYIEGPSRTLFYLPDIDKWSRWSTPIEEVLARVDVALLDATFYDGAELPGRDMAEIPHPFVVETLERLSPLSSALRSRARLIHLNHTNPLLDPASAASATVLQMGLGVAIEGERHEL